MPHSVLWKDIDLLKTFGLAYANVDHDGIGWNMTQKYVQDYFCYGHQVSYSALPNHGAAREIQHRWNKSVEYIKENYVVLNLFMRDTYIETHTQAKATSRLTVLSESN